VNVCGDSVSGARIHVLVDKSSLLLSLLRAKVSGTSLQRGKFNPVRGSKEGIA